MKKILLVCLLIFLSILGACSPSEAPLRLSQVLNLKVQKNVLTFDPVENADSYILNINSLNVSITETTFTFETTGLYKVLVKAVGEGYLDSLFSEPINFEVRFLNYPSDISIINRQLNYTAVAGATAYNIEINGVVYSTKTSLLPTFIDGTYDIRIQSLSDVFVDSVYSPMVQITINSDDQFYSSHNYTYSLLSTHDLLLYTYKSEDIVNLKLERFNGSIEAYELVDLEHIFIKDESVYLKRTYLETLDVNTTFKFRLISNYGYHDINLKINEENKPYVYSDVLVQSNFLEDLIFRFETFNTKFISLTGHMITNKDYHYLDGVLIVDVDYIKETFESNLELDQMLLTYRFEENEMVYIGFIVIKR